MCTRRIFEQDSVVEEWENFLVGIASSPRPPPLERHRLAVDSSNFTRCEARRHSDIDAGDVVVDRPPVARIERSLSVTSHQNCTGCAQSAQPLRNKSCETEDEAESEAPELLYAVVFTVQAVPNGSERLDLLAEVTSPRNQTVSTLSKVRYFRRLTAAVCQRLNGRNTSHLAHSFAIERVGLAR